MTNNKRDLARERRSDKRAIDVGVGKKKFSDAMIKEATEEAFDWLERGGWRRIWKVIKVTILIFVLMIMAAVFYLLETLN
ncbi:hypothetical protein [Roseovarius aquimarinus]|uniref:Preprotein translocase subunit SecE n=1 Tax=Roseovarius aquimarinus TaxID=1229156 RepID=A0ABW7I4N5_9RHOB